MPKLLLQTARTLKAWIWHLTHLDSTRFVSLEDRFPWSSPNVWERIVNFYLARPSPIIFEYGLGVSSVWHIRNLLSKGGGTYIGVEHKPEWYAEVLHSVMRYAIRSGLNVEAHGRPEPMPVDFPVAAYDTVLRLQGSAVVGCTVYLKLRPPYNRTKDADGTLAEFRGYVYALTEPADVVIVDGRARKACVSHVLDNGLLKPGGLLVLMEAGRGVEGWLGWPALTGTSDYQPEVKRMLSLGGELVDGCGLDRWPGLKKRRTPGSNAYHYPSEACFLHLRSATEG